MNAMSIRSLTLAIIAAILVALARPIQAEDITVQVGITGSNSLEGLQDPVTVARLPEVSALLQAIADKPRSADYIEKSLSKSEANLNLLVELGLVKSWDGGYAIGFNYLTLEDHELLVTMLAPHAESLAQSYRDKWPEFQAIFKAYGIETVDMGEIAYAVLGAMSLDWDGLDITAEKNLRITADNLPGGRDFLIWAKEQSSEINVKELYWGSHNTTVNGICFTTFGDHYSLPRHALPDLLWNTSSRVAMIDNTPRALRISANKALAPYYQDDFLADVGNILGAMRDGAITIDAISGSMGTKMERTEAILTFLTEMQYVKHDGDSYVIVAPYFSHADRPMLDAARELGWQLMVNWLDANYSTVEAELDALTARKYGIPYRQLYTQIWHYLFGLANKALVESGHFADPYAEERVSKGMLPFVFVADLIELHTELGH
jgi:DNA-binding IclR family transcriptional regulator